MTRSSQIRRTPTEKLLSSKAIQATRNTAVQWLAKSGPILKYQYYNMRLFKPNFCSSSRQGARNRKLWIQDHTCRDLPAKNTKSKCQRTFKQRPRKTVKKEQKTTTTTTKSRSTHMLTRKRRSVETVHQLLSKNDSVALLLSAADQEPQHKSILEQVTPRSPSQQQPTSDQLRVNSFQTRYLFALSKVRQVLSSASRKRALDSLALNLND